MAIKAPPDVDLRQAAPAPAKYEALREHFSRKIERGELAPGEALPTEQTLTQMFGVARNTVRRAMASLERDKLITRVRGKGTFVHDSAGQRLQKRSELFALVVPETRTGFYPSLLHGFEAASGKSQHQAIVCNTGNCADKQASAILQLIDKKVAGVAMVPTTEPPTPACQIRPLQESQIPVVFCHRPVEGIQAPLLSLPFEKIGRIAGETLLTQGHRQVAFFSPHASAANDRCLEGLQASLRKARANLNEKDIWWGGSSSPVMCGSQVTDALDLMLSRPDRPTAIFTTFDSMAELIHMHLASKGLAMPEDISLISFGGTWRGTPMLQRLTSVVVDEAATAQKAVELLTEMQEGLRSLTDDEQFELPLAVSEGETVGPPSK